LSFGQLCYQKFKFSYLVGQRNLKNRHKPLTQLSRISHLLPHDFVGGEETTFEGSCGHLMATFIKLTDKKGKFIGGSTARRKYANKIQNPLAREKLKECIDRRIHPQERMLASILRSLPREILKSHSFPSQRNQLRMEMCERVGLPPLEPLKSKYGNIHEFNSALASMVLEEARCIIAESIFRRWGKDRKPPIGDGIELEFLSHEKMKGSDHLVYFFQAKQDIRPSLKSELRMGSVVELMPLGYNSVDNIVLGNVLRYSQRGEIDLDDVSVGRQLSIMIYNVAGETFKGGVRLVPLESMLNLTRQFDVCTNGRNDLNGELLGHRQKQGILTVFDYDDKNDQSLDSNSKVANNDVDNIFEFNYQGDNLNRNVSNTHQRAPFKTQQVHLVKRSNENPQSTFISGRQQEDFLFLENIIKIESGVESSGDEGACISKNVVKNESEDAPFDVAGSSVIKSDEDRIVKHYLGDSSRSSSEVRELLNNPSIGSAITKEPSTDNQTKRRFQSIHKVNFSASLGSSVIRELPEIDCKQCDSDVKELRESGYYVPKLNPTQLKASFNFLKGSLGRISIVQGPPGTGKTTLLVSIVCRYLFTAARSKQRKRLLISAPTNKAVSVVAIRVLEAIRDDQETSAVLIGDQERLLADNEPFLRRFFVYTWRAAMISDWEKICKLIESQPIKDHDVIAIQSMTLLKRLNRQLEGLIDDKVRSTMSLISSCFIMDQNKSSYSYNGDSNLTLLDRIKALVKLIQAWDDREVVRSLLSGATIIFCTLSSAGAEIMKETAAVDDVIVDEASAATVPELCIGLWLVKSRLLLVGDPQQLPASVNSDFGKKNGLEKSLQERLMYDCNFPFTILDVQYRMKEEISRFPFKTFYRGLVLDGENVLAFSYQADAAVLNSEPYAFIQVNGEEKKDSLGSCFNSGECEVVASLLQQLRTRSRHLGKDWSDVNRIRVITFYQAQVNIIRKRLQDLGLQRVLVSTVDSSQGCEADIVIISFVRSRQIGFLSDYRRLNVALTRAKHQLICVGNVHAMAAMTGEKAEIASALAHDAIERRCVVADNAPERRQKSNAMNDRYRNSDINERRKITQNNRPNREKESTCDRDSNFVRHANGPNEYQRSLGYAGNQLNKQRTNYEDSNKNPKRAKYY
jgi:AAA domain